MENEILEKIRAGQRKRRETRNKLWADFRESLRDCREEKKLLRELEV